MINMSNVKKRLKTYSSNIILAKPKMGGMFKSKPLDDMFSKTWCWWNATKKYLFNHKKDSPFLRFKPSRGSLTEKYSIPKCCGFTEICIVIHQYFQLLPRTEESVQTDFPNPVETRRVISRKNCLQSIPINQEIPLPIGWLSSRTRPWEKDPDLSMAPGFFRRQKTWNFSNGVGLASLEV